MLRPRKSNDEVGGGGKHHAACRVADGRVGARRSRRIITPECVRGSSCGIHSGAPRGNEAVGHRGGSATPEPDEPVHSGCAGVVHSMNTITRGTSEGEPRLGDRVMHTFDHVDESMGDRLDDVPSACGRMFSWFFLDAHEDKATAIRDSGTSSSLPIFENRSCWTHMRHPSQEVSRVRTNSMSSFRFLIVILAVLGLFAASCGDDEDVATESTTTQPDETKVPDSATEPSTTETTAEPTTTSEATTTSETTTTEPEPELEVVRVYWLRDTGIAVGGREVASTSLPDAALEALLAGPNTLESELEMSTAIPEGTDVLGLVIDGGVATIDLSSEFEATGMGTAGEIGLVSQFVFTLTQFPTVDSVDITIDGEVRDAILSHGLEATGLTRDGLYDAISPAIVVESPYPGQLVTSPLTVTGFSRTFEATVVYDIVIPPSGEIVASGFTTAVQPDVNLFGPFEFTDEFETAVEGFGAVIVFNESAIDGSQIDIYEVPVMMEPPAD